MKSRFARGDSKTHSFTVGENDFASFETGNVHKVCGTFALGREMEWSSRLFVLDMLEEKEEGIGTFLEITHHSPALLGETLQVQATVDSLRGHELICRVEVKSADRLIATGRTGQKVLSKEKINQIFTSLER